mgnify:CR=1 FL=1
MKQQIELNSENFQLEGRPQTQSLKLSKMIKTIKDVLTNYDFYVCLFHFVTSLYEFLIFFLQTLI